MQLPRSHWGGSIIDREGEIDGERERHTETETVTDRDNDRERERDFSLSLSFSESESERERERERERVREELMGNTVPPSVGRLTVQGGDVRTLVLP